MKPVQWQLLWQARGRPPSCWRGDGQGSTWECRLAGTAQMCPRQQTGQGLWRAKTVETVPLAACRHLHIDLCVWGTNEIINKTCSSHNGPKSQGEDTTVLPLEVAAQRFFVDGCSPQRASHHKKEEKSRIQGNGQKTQQTDYEHQAQDSEDCQDEVEGKVAACRKLQGNIDFYR